jgi:hypothetical protein
MVYINLRLCTYAFQPDRVQLRLGIIQLSPSVSFRPYIDQFLSHRLASWHLNRMNSTLLYNLGIPVGMLAYA